MGFYRKKPVVVEAIQFTEAVAWESFLQKKPVFPNSRLFASGSYHPGDNLILSAHVPIKTVEGTMKAELNDWIIKGIKGEFYPCKPDIFEATYEPAEG